MVGCNGLTGDHPAGNDPLLGQRHEKAVSLLSFSLQNSFMFVSPSGGLRLVDALFSCYIVSMSITQAVEIPASHRLVLDVPREVPAGPVILTFTPAPAVPEEDSALARIRSYTFPVIEEILAGAERKMEERQTAIKTTGTDPLQKHCGALKGFFGEDSAAYQRKLRDEWPD